MKCYESKSSDGPTRATCPRCNPGKTFNTPVDEALPGTRTFNCGSGEMGTLYWSKADTAR